MKPIDCFRKAAKAIVKNFPKDERPNLKAQIASSAGIDLEDLAHLMMGRRVGTETIRRSIASFLGYPSYDDFLMLGEELLKGRAYVDAKALVDKQRALRPELDGSLERILTFWPKLENCQKVELRQTQRMMVFKNLDKEDQLEKFKQQSKERFQYLWDSAIGNKSGRTLLDWHGTDLLLSFLEGKTSDVEVLEYVDNLKSNLPDLL